MDTEINESSGDYDAEKKPDHSCNYGGPITPVKNALSAIDVMRMIDKSLSNWQPNAIRYQKLIDDALRTAFVERSLSLEGLADARKAQVLQDRVTVLGKEVEGLFLEVKSANSTISRIQHLEAELEKSNKEKEELRMELSELALLVSDLRRQFKDELGMERNKRLALFNRWVKRHGQDLEKLRNSMEENVSSLQSKCNDEWTVQARCLDELKEKLDIALIRRLGYLPSPATACLPGTSAGAGEFETNVGLRAGLNYKGAPPLMYSATSADRLVDPRTAFSSSRSKDIESSASKNIKESIFSRRVPLNSSAPRAPARRMTSKQLGVATHWLSSGESSGHETDSVDSAADTAPLAAAAISSPVSHDAPYLAGLFDQGMDATNVISSMDSRIEALMEQVSLFQAEQKQSKAEFAQRQRHKHAGLSSGAEADAEAGEDSNKDAKSVRALRVGRATSAGKLTSRNVSQAHGIR